MHDLLERHRGTAGDNLEASWQALWLQRQAVGLTKVAIELVGASTANSLAVFVKVDGHEFLGLTAGVAVGDFRLCNAIACKSRWEKSGSYDSEQGGCESHV